ncbi:MAG: oligosaccharide flippase family protein [Acidobacteriota bacterium]
MSRIKRNVFANLAGSAWAPLLAIALVPFYLRYLGIEAYALVGIFTLMQTSLVLFDLGLGLTVTRGLARLSLQENPEASQRDLLRTVEGVYLTIAMVIAVGVWLGAEPISLRWIQPGRLPIGTVITAVRWMGIANAMYYAAMLYRSALLGLDRQVLMNAVTVVFGTVRAAGALAVLVLWSPGITAFLRWQTLAVLGLVLTFAHLTWRTLRGPTPARFRPELLRQEWRYSAKVSTSLILNVIITNADKVFLSALLPLATFGYYTLASGIAAAPALITVPMNTAVFARLTQLIESGMEEDLASLYHTTAQTIAILVLPGAALVIFFSRSVIRLWTHNPDAVANASGLASLLICSTAVIGLCTLPGFMASAGGKPQVMTRTNIGAVIVILPLMAWVAPRFGAVGAASVWIVLSLFHLFGAVPLAHRFFLRGELMRWYVDDTLKPILAVAAVVVPARLLLPHPASIIGQLAFLASIFLASTLAAVAASNRVRNLVMSYAALALRSASTR